VVVADVVVVDDDDDDDDDDFLATKTQTFTQRLRFRCQENIIIINTSHANNI